MRQLAWLHARPKGLKGKPGEESRWRRIENAGGEIDLPEPGPAAYLLPWLFEAGPMQSGGMGPSALSWQEITSWSRMAGIALRPWEASALRDCSQAYLTQLHEAEEEGCPQPFIDLDRLEQRRAAVGSALQSLFSAKAKERHDPDAKASMRRPPGQAMRR